MPAPALDLTTSLRGDSEHFHCTHILETAPFNTTVGQKKVLSFHAFRANQGVGHVGVSDLNWQPPVDRTVPISHA